MGCGGRGVCFLPLQILGKCKVEKFKVGVALKIMGVCCLSCLQFFPADVPLCLIFLTLHNVQMVGRVEEMAVMPRRVMGEACGLGSLLLYQLSYG